MVIIPHENKRDLKEIPKNIKHGLEIMPVRWIDEVLELALQHVPEPRAASETEAEVKVEENKDHNEES